MFKYGEKAEIVGDLDIQSFGMKVGAKGFNILISRIYSHKIRAAIREPLCNAYDAHSMNNNTEDKVQLSLPNIIDPHLRIRDFGPGLRPDQMGMYVTLFESSKEDSAEGTGFYGLGSKAPFCYTNSFNITTFVDGIKRQYSAFLDGQDAPKIAMLISEPTTEKNGVEVAIPVEQADFKEFETECTQLLAAFKVKPEINGVCEIPSIHARYKSNYYNSTQYKEIELEHVDLCFALGERHYSRSGRLTINCANIIYSVDLDSNRSIYSEYRKYTWMQSCNIVLKCKKSDVSVPPSREHLEYTEETVANIIKMLETANAELIQHYSSEIEQLPSVSDKLSVASEYCNSGVNIDPNTILSDVFGTNSIQSYRVASSRNGYIEMYERGNSIFDKLRNAAVDTKIVFIQDTQTGMKTVETITAEKAKSDGTNINNTVIQMRTEAGALCYSKAKYASLLQTLKDTIRDLADLKKETKSVKVMFTSELDRSVKKEMKAPTVYQYNIEKQKFKVVDSVDFSTVPKSTFVVYYTSQGFNGSINDFIASVSVLIKAGKIDKDVLIYGTLKKNADSIVKKYKLQNHDSFNNITFTDEEAFETFKYNKRAMYYSYSGRLDYDYFKISNAKAIIGEQHPLTKIAESIDNIPSKYTNPTVTERIKAFQTELVKPYIELLDIVSVGGQDSWNKFANVVKLIDSTGDKQND